jgi:hypothetical protein
VLFWYMLNSSNVVHYLIIQGHVLHLEKKNGNH